MNTKNYRLLKYTESHSASGVEGTIGKLADFKNVIDLQIIDGFTKLRGENGAAIGFVKLDSNTWLEEVLEEVS
jgi:hypothetical protein